jgi:MFS family permease
LASFTVMSGAVIAASLPNTQVHFRHVPDADVLVRLVLTLPSLCIAVASPLAGWIIDTRGRRWLMVFSILLYALAGVMGYFVNDLHLLLVSRGLLGIGVAGTMTCVTTAVADCIPSPQARQRFLGLQGGVMAGSGMLLITTGGILSDFNWRLPYLLYLSILPMLPLALRYIPAVRCAPSESDSLSRDASGAPLSPPSNRIPLTVFLIYGVVFVGMVAFYMLPVQGPFLMREVFHVSNSLGGLAIGLATLMAAVASLSYRWLRGYLGYSQVMALSYALTGTGFAFIWYANTYAQAVVGLLIAGLGSGLISPNTASWLMELAPPHLRGRLLGGFSAAIFLGQFASPLLLQPVISVLDLQRGFLVVAGLLGLLSVALVVSMAARRRQQAALAAVPDSDV